MILQQRVRGRWRSLPRGRGRVGRHSSFTIVHRFGARGLRTIRAVVRATRRTRGAVSAPTDVNVGVVLAGIHKIRHVVIIMQENRSFDSFFGTYPGADGIPMENGRPTVCAPDPRRHACERPYHDEFDRNGNRIDRRNPQDIFTPLYNSQIPPGAADAVHYAFSVPLDARAPLTVEARLQYRKFDATYVKYFQRDPQAINSLPVITLASDQVVFPISGSDIAVSSAESKIEPWQRWNDYGIGLFRKGGRGELRQAEAAFAEVEKLGRGDGALNIARVSLREGRLDEAAAALERAAKAKIPAYPWSITWFTGLVNKQNGSLDDAIRNFRNVIDTNFSDARAREFDFSQDYSAPDELGAGPCGRS